MGKTNNRLAITRDGVDVARVMLGSPSDGKFDVILTLGNREYDILAYPLFRINPIHVGAELEPNSHVTYHHGAGGRDVVIHIKNLNNDVEGSPYTDIPLTHIIAPNDDTIVPLPLLKIELPPSLDSSGANTQKRKSKSGKRFFEMDSQCDVAEVYLVSPNWVRDRAMKMFPEIFQALIALPFEAWSSGRTAINESKRTAVPIGQSFDLFRGVKMGCVDLLIMQYHQPFMPQVNAPTVTFIDNALAEPMMLQSQVSYAPNGLVMTSVPILDRLHFPTFLQVNDLRNQSIWLRALRDNRVPPDEYYALEQRVEIGRKELLNGLIEAKEQNENDRKLIQKLVDDFLLGYLNRYPDGCGSAYPIANKHLCFTAEAWGGQVLFHSTHISGGPAEVDEWYTFVTIGNFDVHLDIDWLCRLAQAEARDVVHLSEGRPFSEGLSGLRGPLFNLGYVCGETYTCLMCRNPNSDDIHDLIDIPLYAVKSPIAVWKEQGGEIPKAIKELMR